MVRGNKSIFSHGLIAATLLAVSFAARAEMTYTITSYPAGLADLPCDAFKKILTGRGRRSPFSLRAALSSSASISRIPTRRASSRASAIRNRDWRLGSCCRQAQISDQAATHYAPAVFQRVLTGFLAISLHFRSGSAAARDLPPFAPPSCLRLTAAESLPCYRGPILDLSCRDVPN